MLKLFLINLDRQPERLHRMENIFSEQGLTFNRIPAVDGKKLSEAELDHWRKAAPRRLRAGETACFLSHRACWQRIVDEASFCATIFEDDLHVSPTASALFSGSAWFPPDADIVKIETKLQYVCIDKAVTITIDGRTLHRLRSRHAGAGAYIVTRRGAEKLLGMSETFGDPVDQFIFNPELPSGASLVVYQLLPAAYVQDFVLKDPKALIGLGSDLHGERVLNKPTGWKKNWREIKRPFFQLKNFGARSFSNAVTAKKWVFVDFN